MSRTSADTSPKSRGDRGCRATPDDRRAAFTLIELLVVIVIIGILAAIGIPVFLNQRNKAYDIDAKATMHKALLDFEIYFADHQSFTNAESDMRAVDPSMHWQTSYGNNKPDASDAPGWFLTFEQANEGGVGTVVMTFQSRSRRCFYQRIVEDNTLAGGVTYRIDPPPTPPAGCDDPYAAPIVNPRW